MFTAISLRKYAFQENIDLHVDWLDRPEGSQSKDLREEKTFGTFSIGELQYLSLDYIMINSVGEGLFRGRVVLGSNSHLRTKLHFSTLQ